MNMRAWGKDESFIKTANQHDLEEVGCVVMFWACVLCSKIIDTKRNVDNYFRFLYRQLLMQQVFPLHNSGVARTRLKTALNCFRDFNSEFDFRVYF